MVIKIYLLIFFYENINELEKVINDVNREKDLLNNELVNSAFIYTNREGYTLVTLQTTNTTNLPQNLQEFLEM